MLVGTPDNINQVGDTAGAIQHYELAGTHCVEVPRMLFERGRVEDLEEYITQVLRDILPVRCSRIQRLARIT